MSKRQKLRRALHIKNFILICGLGFILLVFLSGILPIWATREDYHYPQTLGLSFTCLSPSKVKAFVTWPQDDKKNGPYEVLLRENKDSSWRHLLVTQSTLTILEDLFPGKKYDFLVSNFRDTKRWAQANGAATPTCSPS
ncbi:fibronectin type III domain-containing protein [Candidatus Woesebacteria bacterium]|nr:fibronectin type III domain-containing protein [Candidatus Woesebacteria bacterium]